MDSEVGGHLPHRHTRSTVPRDAYDVLAELFRVRLGHSDILPTRPTGKPLWMPPDRASDPQLTKTIARYGRVDLLCIDELGYLELDRRGAEMLFQVLTEREEKNSVAIASNESFGGWTKTFTDPRLCAAIVDRLTFNGTIIETGTDSYRLASTRARAAEPAKAG
ncbi:hypothetical protein GCM10010341_51640 [Streptomyces noursei]|nr:hypothetical protein GCM10010341_51640 [Streptomyces noursei]